MVLCLPCFEKGIHQEHRFISLVEETNFKPAFRPSIFHDELTKYENSSSRVQCLVSLGKFLTFCLPSGDFETCVTKD